jgi:hypothetical protein
MMADGRETWSLKFPGISLVSVADIGAAFVAAINQVTIRETHRDSRKAHFSVPLLHVSYTAMTP